MLWYTYRIKFAQVIDDAKLDLGANLPEVWADLAGQPDHPRVPLRAQQGGGRQHHGREHSVVVYRNGVFTVRLAPRQPQRGRMGRKSEAQPKAKAGPRPPQAQPPKQRQKVESQPQPRARVTPAPPIPNPSYWSGAVGSSTDKPQSHAPPKASSAQKPAPWVRQEPRRALAGARASSPPLHLDARPKKQARARQVQNFKEGAHNHQVVDLLRSVANLIDTPRPSSAPLRILDMHGREI